jgi:murein DD-endopeptidase MepM/ murein hydrolase activator NlpD
MTRLLFVLLAAVSLAAQERPPLVSTIDVQIPVPPTVVRIAGRAVIAYELHLTNFQTAPAAIAGVQLQVPGRPDAFVEYRADELKKRIGRPGLSRPYEAADVIGPGMRAVVYLWIEFPGSMTPPATLQHRVDVELRRPAGAVRSVVTTAPMSISVVQPVVLDPPLRGGPWTAIYDPLLMGGHRTAIYTLDGRARIPSRFAIDWIRTDVAAGSPGARPADWNGYGEEVLAVADATVARAMDDIAENADPPVATSGPMAPEIASGNYVSLDLGGGRFVFYEHLRRGSVLVKTGDRVKRGQVIARLGNSGSSSIGPHLHFHVADTAATLGAEGLPFVFRQFDLLGAFANIDAARGGAWERRQQYDRRTLEHPAANTVVRFR